ncbi:hypothetical protein B0H11DRAFT_2359306 [Mycena galericulata]|nr:hypothetical protein B0H11DRAFT_2359306 [Mycena galericulata]
MAPRVILPIQPGLVHTPSTHEATVVLEELLCKDYVSHHIFFNDLGFHDHISHHLVSAYDMGASPALLKLIYQNVSQIMRPLDQKEDITESNWTARLGEYKAYSSYLAFFSDQISKQGMEETFQKYVMAPSANGNDSLMFARFFEGAIHPFIHAGLGAEFGNDFMFAQGLALCAVTESEMTEFVLDQPSNLPEIKETTKGVTLLALLREVYDSAILKPVLPDNPNAPAMERFRKFTQQPERGAELRRIYAKWSIDTTLTGAASDKEFDSKVEECLWQATLILAATGRPNRSPIMDFFLMHVLTSALSYARSVALWVLVRGRPRIGIPLMMSYTDSPGPAAHGLPGGADALDAAANPWLAIIQNALQHKDAHVIKTVRALYYCAQRYGLTAPGEAIGARDEEGGETHVGAGKMDGSVFVRAAGVVTETLGWVAYGGKAGDWDRSPIALGWDAAWD